MLHLIKNLCFFQGISTRQLIIDNFSINQVSELNLNRPANVESQDPFARVKDLLDKAGRLQITLLSIKFNLIKKILTLVLVD